MGDKEGLKKHKEGVNTKGRWRIPRYLLPRGTYITTYLPKLKTTYYSGRNYLGRLVKMSGQVQTE